MSKLTDKIEELADAEALLEMYWARPMDVWADRRERHEAINAAQIRVAVLKNQLKEGNDNE